MISGIGPTELAVVLVIALLVLGPKRLPSAGRSLGQGLREFKAGVTGRERSGDRSALEPAPPEDSA
jgi:sec-independent protein translocase protein TatA